MFPNGTVFAAHYACAHGCTAVNAFASAVSVDVLTGRGLEAPVAVRSGTAIHAAFFIGIVLMEAIQAFRAAGAELVGTAVYTFGHKIPLYYTEFMVIYRHFFVSP